MRRLRHVQLFVVGVSMVQSIWIEHNLALLRYDCDYCDYYFGFFKRNENDEVQRLTTVYKTHQRLLFIL